MNWYLQALKKYAVFDGRARRKEYWFFVLFNFIFAIVLVIVDSMMGNLNPDTGYGVLSTIYTLAVLIPGIAVTIRRLHDTDRSGLWWLILFIPLIGAVVLLVFMVIDGTSGQNKYGPDPKSI